MKTKIQTQPEIQIEPDWDFLNYAFDAEKAWRKSLSRFTDRELFIIFPEAKKEISHKLREREKERKTLVEIIRRKLTAIRDVASNDFERWFGKKLVAINDGQELLKIDNHIARLHRLSCLGKRRTPKSGVTQEMIQNARAVSIENLITQEMRKSGKTLVGLCPLHQEKTPSFYAYPESNSFYCFGCGQGGDVITFVKLLHGYSFVESVRYLTNQ